LGGDLVARDEEKILGNKITHVINCARAYSEEYHKDKGVTYKSYYLGDNTQEDIACIFYDAMDFMMQAKREGGRVFVHCVQGISRSATICIAYLIFVERMSYNDGYTLVRGRRACANPNMAFITQLNQWYKRLLEPSFESIRKEPRVFMINSHAVEDPQRVVARFLLEPLYSRAGGKVLDPRFYFIIQTKHKLWLWKGS
jgi:hypothetical protein